VLQGFHLSQLLGFPPGSMPAILLGSTFDWADILGYAAGALLIVAFRRVPLGGDIFKSY